MESHSKMTQSQDSEEQQMSVTKVKNIMNCLLHLFLFKSIGSQFLFDVIKYLLNSFSESDIEVLIFVLHNIGLQLRKQDPASIKQILDLFNQKKNSYTAQKRLEKSESEKSMEP